MPYLVCFRKGLADISAYLPTYLPTFTSLLEPLFHPFSAFSFACLLAGFFTGIFVRETEEKKGGRKRRKNLKNVTCEQILFDEILMNLKTFVRLNLYILVILYITFDNDGIHY